MRLLIGINLFLLTNHLSAQQIQTSISFQFTFNDQPIELGDKYYLKSTSDSISIETLKLYVSNIELLDGEKIIEAPNKKQFLIDLENKNSQHFYFARKNSSEYSKIKFNLGIDSITNTSGAMGGDLDPTNGMYWAWQSGYINFKLEGKTNSCPARNHLFQFHIGGYLFPFNTLQKVELKTEVTETIIIKLNLDQLLNEIDLKQTYQIMNPNNDAVKIAKIISNCFEISK